MAEWLKAPVLKTGDVERHRGFESLSLRDISSAVEKYPSGRRGSPAKGVGWDNRRPGSNPGFSASQSLMALSFLYSKNPTLGVGFGRAYSYAKDRKLLLL